MRVVIVTAWVGREYCSKYYLESVRRLKVPDGTAYLVVDASKKGFNVEPWMKDKFSEVVVHKGVVPDNPEAVRSEKFENIRQNHCLLSRYSQDIKGDYVLVFDDDMSVPNYGLERLLKLTKLDKFGFGCAWSNHKSYYPDAVGRPTVWRFVSDNPDKYSAKMGDDIRLETIMPPPEWAKVTEIDACGTAFALFRKKLFDGHEFVIERNGLFGIDITLCYKIRRLGYKGYVDWTVKTCHYELIDGEVVVW